MAAKLQIKICQFHQQPVVEAAMAKNLVVFILFICFMFWNSWQN